MFLFLKEVSQWQNNHKPLTLKGFLVVCRPQIEPKQRQNAHLSIKNACFLHKKRKLEPVIQKIDLD